MATNYREIWENGTPLNEAWLRWATDNNRDKYNAKPEEPNIQNIRSKKLIERIRAAQSVLGNFRRPFDLQRLMRKDLVQWLMDKDPYALGFRFPAAVRSEPKPIPTEFWINAEINWEKEIANDANSNFQTIRIVDPDEFPVIKNKPKIGRPTSKPLIYKVIKEIVKTNRKFQSDNHKEKAKQIRDYIRIHKLEPDPFGQGLKDGAIRKHVNSFFQEKSKE